MDFRKAAVHFDKTMRERSCLRHRQEKVMEQRRLGGQGLVVSALGLGCMGMSWAYGPRDDAESVATVHEAMDLGITFFDTAEVYATYENERLLGRAVQGRRDPVVIATKFGFQ